MHAGTVTVPVAIDGDTVTAKITDWPTADGFRLEVIAVVVLGLTTCTRTAELLKL